MYPHLNNLINDKDPTGYVDLKFIGKQGETMWDKRFGPESYFAEFFVFSVNFKHSDEIKLYVNSEFKSHEKVAEIALKFSKMIGSVPIFLRKHLKWVFIHGPWEDKSKCTCMWYAARNYGIVIHTEMVALKQQEEVLIHEAAHVTIDSIFYGSTKQSIWTNAQKKDGASISRYAKKYPDREDIAESIVAWVAVRCKKDRITKAVYDEIIKTIPNRLIVLDRLISGYFHYPLTCKI